MHWLHTFRCKSCFPNPAVVHIQYWKNNVVRN
jgi:hypothetical protein